MTALSELGAGALGVWTREQARTALTDGAVDALVRGGTWQVMWRGVYADGGYEPDAGQRAQAAVLAVGGGRTAGGPGHVSVACGRTAARVWRLPLVDDADPVTGAYEHRIDDVSVTRQHWDGRVLVPHEQVLRPEEVVRLPSGLLVTTPLRTLVDCARLVTPDALVCLLDAALHAGRVDQPAVRAATEQRRRRRGAAALRTALSRADGRAESAFETLTRVLLLPVLPGLEPQVELYDHVTRLVARFDLGERSTRFAVESDGRAGHAGDHMVAKDRRRDRRTGALGWHTERLTWYEVRREQAAVVRRVLEARAAHLSSPRRPD